MSGLPAWGVGALSALASQKVESVAASITEHPAVKALGLSDGQNIDIDTLYKALHEQAKKSDAVIDLNILGLRIGTVKLTAADVDALYREIRNA